MSDPGYVSVKGFERFQHYKDRRPPWIKLYTSIFEDYEFACLQDASKLHLVSIWVLASQLDNRIPADPEWIARRINATTAVDLSILIEKGFLIASKLLASCKQNAMPETETETDIKNSPSESKKEASKRARLCPTDFQPDAAGAALLAGLSLEDRERIVSEFVTYWQSTKSRRKDWQATFRKSPVVNGAAHKARNPKGNGKRSNGRFQDKLKQYDDDNLRTIDGETIRDTQPSLGQDGKPIRQQMVLSRSNE